MIFANDLYYQNDVLFRILWTDEKNNLVACIAVEDDKGVPELMPYTELSSLVSEGIVNKSDSDPYSNWPLETTLSVNQKGKRDRNWELIESLARSEPQIFFPEERGSLLREKSKASGVALPTLYRLLRRYWQRGLCKNALLPDYRHCGAKGQSKQAVEKLLRNVSEGSSLNKAMSQTRYFPPLMIHMVASGESTGELDQMLERIAHSQQQELESKTALMLGLFEPLMLVVMGGIVMFIVLAILLPVLNMNQLLGF